jgi:hypothetical protein
MKTFTRALLLLGLFSTLALPAWAQAARYQLRHALDFDLWCTEEERLPYERCDKRLPEDVKKFEAYRAVIEHYEIPYLKEKDPALRLDGDLLGLDDDDSSAPPPPKSP